MAKVFIKVYPLELDVTGGFTEKQYNQLLESDPSYKWVPVIGMKVEGMNVNFTCARSKDIESKDDINLIFEDGKASKIIFPEFIYKFNVKDDYLDSLLDSYQDMKFGSFGNVATLINEWGQDARYPDPDNLDGMGLIYGVSHLQEGDLNVKVKVATGKRGLKG